LLLVIDEFGELLTADPEFVDVLITIGRIGRSIGVHLLLSSQRVEMGKLRGLETYLSYRIGLRTFSESESASILGTPDAFHLPSAPGFAYLKVDTTTYTRFPGGVRVGGRRGAVGAATAASGRAGTRTAVPGASGHLGRRASAGARASATR
jgi:S-DNA-T family DNA segregation ATPase FtsK/SpoIIIE